MDIVEEVKFPAKESGWIQKVLIGGILGIIPIVNFIAYGYYLKIMKGAIEGNSSMPRWENLGSLFIDGLKVFVISIGYMIVPVLVLLISAGSAIMGILSGDLGAIGSAMGGFLIGLLLVIIFGFMLPMATAMFVKDGSMGSAFRIRDVLSRIKSVFGDYIMVFIAYLVLVIVLGLVSSVPILGLLILVFGIFYISAAVYNMFGEVYTKSNA